MSFDQSRQTTPGNKAIALFMGAMLLVIAVLLHHGASNGGWRYDDVQQIISAKDHSFLQLLFNRSAWQAFTPYFFTPLLAGLYKLDFFLFGYNPRGFYIHGIIDLAAIALFTYLLLVRHFPRSLSFLACIAFLVSMPTFAATDFIQNRHYLTGLFFAISSIYVHQNAHRAHMTRNLLISAGLFFMALMLKEIYAVILLYFVLRSWRTPIFWKSLALYPTLLGIFIVWRYQMLGSFVAGYQINYYLLDRLLAMADVHRSIFGSDIIAASFFGMLGAVVFYHRLFDRRLLGYIAALLAAAYSPLIFATFVFKNDSVAKLRLSFFPVWLYTVGITYIAALLWENGKKKTAGIILLVFLAITSFTSLRDLNGFRAPLREYDAQAAFIHDAGPQSAFFPTAAVDFWGNIHRRLTQVEGRIPSNMIVTQDDVVPGITSFWEYDNHCRCMVQQSRAQAMERLAKIPQPIGNAPISLLVLWETRNGMVSLISSPNLNSTSHIALPGMWLLYSENHPQVPIAFFDFSRSRVSRIRNDGLVTSTPIMQVPIQGAVQWDRGVFLASQPIPTAQPTICQIDEPTQKKVILIAISPLELRGWIQTPSIDGSDTAPFAMLSGSNGKSYTAKLYRESRPETYKTAGVTVIGVHILDADLSRVEPGIYHLLLGVGNAVCDSGSSISVESSTR